MIHALRQIQNEVTEAWPFNEHHYASLKGNTAPRFSFVHMILHVVKEAGLLARIEERAQHRQGKKLSVRDERRVERLAMKIIVTGFRLLSLTDGDLAALERYIKRS